MFGQANTPPDFLYIYVGYFIGGGVVLNGNLYTGSSGNSGAIGPFPVKSETGTFRPLVDVASLIGLERRVVEAGGDAEGLWNDPETWDTNRPVISDWLDEALPAIAQTILSSISIIDFSAILIDGSMPSELRTEIVSGVRSHLRDMDTSGLIVPDIIAGTVGANARPLGAASLALSRRFMLVD